MARINTNVPSLVSQFSLARANEDLDLRLERLSTGLRINRGADDPAGLIISERIGSDLAGIEQAITNGERASSVIATTEAALDEINGLLLEIKGLLVEAANTGASSAEERAANQLAIDSAIQSITRISNTASFGGLRLLDGSLDYTLSGVASSSISKAQVFSASFIGTNRLQVEVDVIASAQRAGVFWDGNDGTRITNGVLTSTTTIQIRGNLGVQEFTFASGSTLSDVRDALNSRSLLTGVSAALVNGDQSQGLVFNSQGFGSDQFVSVKQVGTTTGTDVNTFYKFRDGIQVPPFADPFDMPGLEAAGLFTSATDGDLRDTGQDVQALINGNLGIGNGLEVATNSNALGVELILNADLATDPSATPTTFDITGGGSLFQLGPEVTALQQFNFGVPSVAATNIGGVFVDGGLQFLSSLESGQPNSLRSNVDGNDFSTASSIVDEAIDDVTILRGRLGALERNVLDTNRRSLQSAFENLTASQSVIVDADFAAETSNLTRAQILQSSGTSVLSLANQRAQSVLQLLG